jgi:spore coat protein U-like protein
MKYSLLIVATMLVGIAHNATASQMVYRGVNSNITPGAPYNPNLSATADRNRPYNPRSIRVGQTDAEIVRRTIISTATSQLTSASSTAGHIDFGDGSYADYSTSGGIRTVTITNPDGTSTTISFPI